MRKLITALAVAIMLVIASLAFASAPATSMKDTGLAIVPGQPAYFQGETSVLKVKFDIKDLGFAAGVAETIKFGAMDPGGSSAVLGKTIVQSGKSAIAYKEGSTAPMIATDVLTTGKTFIGSCSTSRTDIGTTYAEPHASYVIARTSAGTLALL